MAFVYISVLLLLYKRTSQWLSSDTTKKLTPRQARGIPEQLHDIITLTYIQVIGIIESHGLLAGPCQPEINFWTLRAKFYFVCPLIQNLMCMRGLPFVFELSEFKLGSLLATLISLRSVQIPNSGYGRAHFPEDLLKPLCHILNVLKWAASHCRDEDSVWQTPSSTSCVSSAW